MFFRYICNKFSEPKMLSLLTAASMKRQYSGDGRTVENPFLLGGDPATPPPESKVQRSLPSSEKTIQEILKAMQTFFTMGKIDIEGYGPAAIVQVFNETLSANLSIQQAPHDKYEETLADHYFLNDTIITIRRYVDKKYKQTVDDSEDDVFSGDGDLGSPSSPNDCAPSSFDQVCQKKLQEKPNLERSKTLCFGQTFSKKCQREANNQGFG